jgi:hypothetical protein
LTEYVNFLKSDDQNSPSSSPTKEKEKSKKSTFSSQVSIGKLSDVAFGFGRMVKKQALAAVERVGAAVPVKVYVHKYLYVIFHFFL